MSAENHSNPSTYELSPTARLEALLFVAPSPVSLRQLAQGLGITPRQVELRLQELEAELARRGIRLQTSRGGYQLTTAPELSEVVEQFLSLDATTRLSQAALEALSIIAYQQPVTRPDIDAVRGVNSDGVLKNLLSKGLIEESGRSEGPGRPILYATTSDFLQHFGLSSLRDLPPLEIPEAPSAEELAANQPELPLKG